MPTKSHSIYFVGNPASISYLVGRELKQRGYDVVVHDAPNLFRTNTLSDIKAPKKTLFSRAFNKARRELSVSNVLPTREYDVEIRSFSGHQVRARNRTIVYHGNDLRDDLWKHWDTRIHFPCFYSSIDLGIRYLPEDLRNDGEAVWLPRAIVQEFFRPVDRLPFDDKHLTVGFFPTDPKMEEKGYVGKGGAIFYQAIKKLEERGYIVELLTPEKTGFKKHEDMPSMFAKCHVVADQFTVGQYGINSLEAIMMNRAPVCFVEDRFFEFWEMKSQIVNCRGDDADSIADALLDGVDHPVDPYIVPKLYAPSKSADVMEKSLQSWGFLN